jgi:uncharacterized membrane protein (UPF0127 family)
MRKITDFTWQGPVMNRAVFLGCFLMVGILLAQDAAPVALPSITLKVGSKAVTAEVADEPEERAMGLMFRKDLARDSGMLFVMREPERAAFWMKNTTLPLSVAYINESGMILEIHDLEPLNEKPVPSAFSGVAYALEMEQGWFAKNRILAGDRIQGLPPLAGH